MLADSVAGFTGEGDTIARARRQKEQGAGLDRGVWRQMAELGWLGILVGEKDGGLGLGVGELAVVAEGLGRACAPEPLVETGFAQSVVAAGDNEALRSALLPRLAEGGRLAAVAWQEDPQRPGPEPLCCTAEPHGSGIALRGAKCLVVPFEADDFLVSARSADGVEIYCVDRNAPGLSFDSRALIDGSRVVDLRLDGVRVDAEQRVASSAAGAEALARGLCVGATLASAALLGLSDRLFEMTTEYLGARKQFGRPLSGFQVLRHRAVDLHVQRELMRASLRAAVRGFDQDQDLGSLQRLASRAKARTSDASLVIARDSVQLHGAIGYTEEADVGVYLRRVLVLSSWMGNAAWHRRRYAEMCREHV